MELALLVAVKWEPAGGLVVPFHSAGTLRALAEKMLLKILTLPGARIEGGSGVGGG